MRSKADDSRMLDAWNQARNIFFLGIGGIGMSAIARFVLSKGKGVSGYDGQTTELTRSLEKEGATVHYEMDSAIPDMKSADLIVYTAAIKADHPLHQQALATGLPFIKRAKILGMLSEAFKCLAVAGTHGKTTTNTMLTHLLLECGVEASAFLGGISHNLKSNLSIGSSDWIVAEADEFDRSFLTLYPEIAAITAMDADHLDIYGDEQSLVEAFKTFASQRNENGKLFIHHSLQKEFQVEKSIYSYGIESGDIQAYEIEGKGWKMWFSWTDGEMHYERLKLPLPGRHNVENMTLAIGMALAAGADPKEIPSAVKSFKGIYRRMDRVWENDSLIYIDDYAHHPAEIQAVLGAVKEVFPGREVIVIFQPHLFSRTQDFQQEFGKALSEADKVGVMNIYPAREKPIPGITHETILTYIENTEAIHLERKLLQYTLEDWITEDTVLLTLGAGDIDKEVDKIQTWLTDKYGHHNNQ